jgi:hypothetical protein
MSCRFINTFYDVSAVLAGTGPFSVCCAGTVRAVYITAMGMGLQAIFDFFTVLATGAGFESGSGNSAGRLPGNRENEGMCIIGGDGVYNFANTTYGAMCGKLTQL